MANPLRPCLDKCTSMNINETKTIVIANTLVQKGVNPLTARQQNILYYLIANIEYNADPETVYTFRTSELCQTIGNSYKTNRTEFLADIKSLADTSWWFTSDKRKSLYRFLDTVEIVGDGTICIRFHRTVAPYLMQLKEQFAKFEYKYFHDTKTVFGKRLYPMLHSYLRDDKDTTVVEVDIEDLKKILFADTKGYTQYTQFETRCLKKAIEDINAKTDIIVEYERITERKKVKGIRFVIDRLNL